MQFNIQADKFLNALYTMHIVFEKKTINPILSNILIKVKDNSITLLCTDSFIFVQTTITEANIQAHGETTVTATQIFETLKHLDSKSLVNFTLQGTYLEMNCENFSGKLATLPAKDFPQAMEGQEISRLQIKSSDLFLLFNQTKTMVSYDETRYFLTGIFLHSMLESGTFKLKAVSTDGHRLGLAEINLNNANLDEGVIVPKKTVDEVLNIADKSEKDYLVNIAITDNQMINFYFKNTFVQSNLIAGTFPEYNKVIPSSYKAQFMVNKDELKNSIVLISNFSNNKVKIIQLNTRQDQLIISAGQDISEGKHTINMQNTVENDFSIFFNARYLLDILGALQEERVIFQISDKTAPVLIKDSEEANYIYVLMPMNM